MLQIGARRLDLGACRLPGAEEIRPVEILELATGMLELALGAIAAFTVRSEAALQRFATYGACARDQQNRTDQKFHVAIHR